VVALVDEREVGLALLSRRGHEGWVSGVGVRPTWRRQGVARQMVVYLQQQAKVEGLQRVRLEVLQQNEGAIRLYEQLGFSWERDLLVMTFSDGVTPPLCPSIDIASAQPAWLLQAYAAFHTCDASWQRDLPSLQKRAPQLQGLALWEKQHLMGYTLYQPYHSALTILDLAVDPAHPDRLETARRLLRGLHMAHPTITATINNLPAQDPLLPAFIKVGYQISQRQYEMAWSVSQGPRGENRATPIVGTNHVTG
jgi:hypothetical protein